MVSWVIHTRLCGACEGSTGRNGAMDDPSTAALLRRHARHTSSVIRVSSGVEKAPQNSIDPAHCTELQYVGTSASSIGDWRRPLRSYGYTR
jgi:hypothetical protein